MLNAAIYQQEILQLKRDSRLGFFRFCIDSVSRNFLIRLHEEIQIILLYHIFVWFLHTIYLGKTALLAHHGVNLLVQLACNFFFPRLKPANFRYIPAEYNGNWLIASWTLIFQNGTIMYSRYIKYERRWCRPSLLTRVLIDQKLFRKNRTDIFSRTEMESLAGMQDIL